MRNSFVLFNRCFVFVALFADITDNLAVFLVAMLVVHVALKAGRMDELETEATLGLTDSVWNKNMSYTRLTASCPPTGKCRAASARALSDSSHF